jgi:hypothetical protein
MAKHLARTALAVVLASLVVPALAYGGTVTLHPSGFGTHTYAAWKAHQGLIDSAGNDDQALYFQKNTFTETNAAAFAVFKGFASNPLPVEDLTGLSFYYGTDGHCGAGAPRFNATVEYTSGTMAGQRQTFFIGCAAMTPGDHQTAPNGRVYERRSVAAPFGIACCGVFPSSGANLVGLSIAFDEGNASTINPAYTSLCNGSTAGSCVYLDNITIGTTQGPMVWTSANDNGNGPAADARTSATTSPVARTHRTHALRRHVVRLARQAPQDLIDTTLMPLGVSVDPTDLELVDALNLADPGVALTDWLLYPNVLS